MFEEEIRSIVGRIAGRCNPKAVIIFGSVARGTCTSDSDLDLLVVLETDLDYYDRTLAVRKAVGPVDIPLDILVFTPEEIEAGMKEKNSIISEAVSNGVVVYGTAWEQGVSAFQG